MRLQRPAHKVQRSRFSSSMNHTMAICTYQREFAEIRTDFRLDLRKRAQMTLRTCNPDISAGPNQTKELRGLPWIASILICIKVLQPIAHKPIPAPHLPR
jgi:hypothetical protein